jgi:hypothetical protein
VTLELLTKCMADFWEWVGLREADPLSHWLALPKTSRLERQCGPHAERSQCRDLIGTKARCGIAGKACVVACFAEEIGETLGGQSSESLEIDFGTILENPLGSTECVPQAARPAHADRDSDLKNEVAGRRDKTQPLTLL